MSGNDEMRADLTTERLVEVVRASARNAITAPGITTATRDLLDTVLRYEAVRDALARAALAAIAREAGGAAELDAAAITVQTLADEPLAAALLRALAGAEETRDE